MKIIRYDGVRQSGCTTMAINKAKELIEKGHKVAIITNDMGLFIKKIDIPVFKKDDVFNILIKEFDILILDKVFIWFNDPTVEVETYYLGYNVVMNRFNGDSDKIDTYIHRIISDAMNSQIHDIKDDINKEIQSILNSKDYDMSKIEKLLYVKSFLDRNK